MNEHAFAAAIDLMPEHVAATGREVASWAPVARGAAGMVARAPALAPGAPVGPAWADFAAAWSRELSITADQVAAAGREIIGAGQRWRAVDDAVAAAARWS